MNRIICLLIALLAIINLLGCAHPTVVESVQGGDYDMTCVELTIAIAEAKRFKAEAKTKKGFTGGNVARGILLWPTILGTYSNVNEAVHAADNRIAHLARIKEEKCGHQPEDSAENIDSSNNTIQAKYKEEILLWEKVREKNTIDMYEIYLSIYPKGTFADVAQSKLKKLNMQELNKDLGNGEDG